LTLSIVGASTGGLMTAPHASQIAEARATHHMAVSGAHTVGAPDGGPGLPGTGWSREHGDIRVAHFVGLHAMQVLPAVAWLMTRRRGPDVRALRLTFVAAGSYFVLFALLLAQALNGQSIAAPSPVFVTAFALWALATGIGVAAATRRQAIASLRTMVNA
jgi:hypothetical protein